MKLVKALKGRNVQLTHGLADSMAQLEKETPEFRQQMAKFLDGLISHYVFDDGKLVVAHAGLKESMQGRGSAAVREFALYGETTGETDDFGLPVRYNWAADYRGKALVVYGHTPVAEPLWLNNTVNLDTGCVFGGSLTALRYPEREIVSVRAQDTYYESEASVSSARCRVAPHCTACPRRCSRSGRCRWQAHRRYAARSRITIREENAIAALEVMSRFAVDPKWIIYLPPTMSPSDTTKRASLLEHPQEAFCVLPQLRVCRKSSANRSIWARELLSSCAMMKVCRSGALGLLRLRSALCIPAPDAASSMTMRLRLPFSRDCAMPWKRLAFGLSSVRSGFASTAN